MSIDKQKDIKRAFLEPANAAHRQYEALRAHFVDGLSPGEAAQRFGYTVGSFRVMACRFGKDPGRRFFVEPVRGPGRGVAKAALHEHVVALRKQNLSVYDISAVLGREGQGMTPAGVSLILKREGFAKLPRRGDEERPAGKRPDKAAVADVRELDLTPRTFRTRFGGLFLFAPFLAGLGLERLLGQAQFPGSDMVPAPEAVRSLLALKLFGGARHSHVMSDVFDEGLALFAGLNVIPKRSFLTEYSCRVDPAAYPVLLRLWFDALRGLGFKPGNSFDLDFHTIPFHGDDALVEKHYVSKRSRRQKGLLAFIANDAANRTFCYVNADIRKEAVNDQVLDFVRFWKERTGAVPGELIFDSKLTTYANLNRLNGMDIEFISLRRRSADMLARIHALPASAWRRIQLANVARAYATPRVLDERIRLNGYDGPLRQISILDLGHEEPTILLTNQMKRSPATLIERYARRMIIENGIADTIDFFHMDALSSAVAMKVNCDLVLTLVASSLYRLLGNKVGNGYARATSRHIFRDLVQATAQVTVDRRDITVRFQKRAHNPMLVAAGLTETATPLPWLAGRRLRLCLG
jgi:hypothetical protein